MPLGTRLHVEGMDDLREAVIDVSDTLASVVSTLKKDVHIQREEIAHQLGNINVHIARVADVLESALRSKGLYERSSIMVDFRDLDPFEYNFQRGDVEADQAVFGFGEVPWWNSADMPAIVVPRAISFEEVFSIAFPWVAEMEQLRYADGGLSSQYGIRRSDTKAELGVHSGRYGNIQPKDSFNFCAAFFQEYAEIPIASALAMRGGKVLNISAKLNEIDVLGSGDIHKNYVCFVNSYDGSLKAQAYMSSIQPVCLNTTRRGIQHAEAKLGYKHTKNVRERIIRDTKDAALLMQGFQATTAQLKEVFEKLATVKPTRQAYEAILDELFGDGEATLTKKRKAEVTSLVANGINATAFPDFRGTGYGIYTALTDWSDHYSPVRHTASSEGMSTERVRMERSLIGEQAQFKGEALTVLERVLVLADGSTEAATRYMDMAASPSVHPRVVVPEVVQSDSWTVADGLKDVQAITEMTSEDWSGLSQPTLSQNTPSQGSVSQDTASQESVNKPDLPPAAVQVDIAPQALLGYIYTTATQESDYPQAIREGIAERVSDTVAVSRIRIPDTLLADQMTAYKAAGCCAFTQQEWLALGKSISPFVSPTRTH